MTQAVSKAFRFVIAFAALFAPSLWAQGPVPDAPTPTPAAVAPIASGFIASTNPFPRHKFWDTENSILFATSAAMNTADFWVTRANLQSGGQELNPLVRVFGKSTAGLATNFAGETAGVVGMSYFFHRTGHHRMERMVSMVNIGSSVGAVSYGIAHRSGPAAASNAAARSDRGITIRLNLSR